MGKYYPQSKVDASAPEKAPSLLRPVWDRQYPFFEHSYRGIAADRETGAVFLAHQAPSADIEGEYGQAWAYFDPEGRCTKQGFLRFPMRGCYPQIAVRGRAVYVMAISDEIEPVHEWRGHKRTVSEAQWDYDFRQLFFTWTADITVHDCRRSLTTEGVSRQRADRT